jgi:hypothetical protein
MCGAVYGHRVCGRRDKECERVRDARCERPVRAWRAREGSRCKASGKRRYAGGRGAPPALRPARGRATRRESGRATAQLLLIIMHRSRSRRCGAAHGPLGPRQVHGEHGRHRLVAHCRPGEVDVAQAAWPSYVTPSCSCCGAWLARSPYRCSCRRCDLGAVPEAGIGACWRTSFLLDTRVSPPMLHLCGGGPTEHETPLLSGEGGVLHACWTSRGLSLHAPHHGMKRSRAQRRCAAR